MSLDDASGPAHFPSAESVGLNFARNYLRLPFIPVSLLIIGIFLMPGCGNTDWPSTGPSNVVVSVQPTSASLFLGQTQAFQASVTGATDASVSWRVNGVPGGNATAGTISASGTYTAPAELTSPASVTIEAVSNAQSTASASATVDLKDDIVVTVTPSPVSLLAGGAQVLTASVSGTGNPATGVTWSVNGIAGGNSTVGTIVPNGANTAVYTAPSVPPSPATVNVMATSVADTTKSGSASVTITCAATNSITPPSASVGLELTQAYSASFCLAAGAAVAWDVNGVVGGNSALGTIASTGVNTAMYAGPIDLPAPNPATIHATANLAAGGTGTAAATVTVVSTVGISVSPGTATVSTS